MVLVQEDVLDPIKRKAFLKQEVSNSVEAISVVIKISSSNRRKKVVENKRGEDSSYFCH